MSRWFPSAVERAVDLPAFCGRCGRAMKHTFRATGFDRATGDPYPAMPAAECPKWDRDPADHEAFVVEPRPPVTTKAPCTCIQPPNGPIPTTLNCPRHGSWRYTA